MSHTPLRNVCPTGQRERVAIVGSGNWGSAIARLAGFNALRHPEAFHEEVKMWVFDEQFEGKSLISTINETHQNAKYLPGIDLGKNVIAVPDIEEAIKGATALVFVLPHQFLPKTLEQLKGKIPSGVKAVTCIKGVDVKEDQIHIFADVIESELGVSCSALSGANIAQEVASDRFSETTIGYRRRTEGLLWQALFQTKQFRVQLIDDVAGVSLCGALKNIVAVAAGFNDGLEWGNNAKAAIMRVGLLEMKHFCQEFFEDVKEESFLQESSGVADLITTCLGGRNRRCAEAFVTAGKTFAELEESMLGGQKLQGIYTAQEIHAFLKAKGRIDGYPLFETVYQISWEGLNPDQLTSKLSDDDEPEVTISKL